MSNKNEGYRSEVETLLDEIEAQDMVIKELNEANASLKASMATRRAPTLWFCALTLVVTAFGFVDRLPAVYAAPANCFLAMMILGGIAMAIIGRRR